MVSMRLRETYLNAALHTVTSTTSNKPEHHLTSMLALHGFEVLYRSTIKMEDSLL